MMTEVESPNNNDTRPRRTGSVIKILCPYYVAGAVIGKGGENIQEIKEKSDTAVVVSQNNVRFPGTNERVISIRGSMDAIKTCVGMIQNKIRTDEPPESVKGPRTENEKRKKCCKLVVSDNTLGRIIGKRGKTVQEMKQKYSVEINTTRRSETPFGLDERAVSVEGEEACVDECTDEIIKIVCEDTYASMRFVTDYEMFFVDRRGGNNYGYFMYGPPGPPHRRPNGPPQGYYMQRGSYNGPRAGSYDMYNYGPPPRSNYGRGGGSRSRGYNSGSYNNTRGYYDNASSNNYPGAYRDRDSYSRPSERRADHDGETGRRDSRN